MDDENQIIIADDLIHPFPWLRRQRKLFVEQAANDPGMVRSRAKCCRDIQVGGAALSIAASVILGGYGPENWKFSGIFP